MQSQQLNYCGLYAQSIAKFDKLRPEFREENANCGQKSKAPGRTEVRGFGQDNAEQTCDWQWKQKQKFPVAGRHSQLYTQPTLPFQHR